MKATIGILATLALLALAACGAWYYASPGWTLDRMQAAADAKDADALSAYIDFPALREDLKSELSAQMMAKAKEDQTGLAPLAAALGSALISPMVDAMVTPAAMRTAFAADTATPDDQSARTGSMPPTVKLGKDPVITRQGFDAFRVAPRGEQGGLIFKRSGFSWKLSGIDLPPETTADTH